VDVIAELEDYGVNALVHDAMADLEEAREELGVDLCTLDDLRNLDALILAVSHDQYKDLSIAELKTWFAVPENALIIDVKCFFDRAELQKEGVDHWRL
jgi:UDP-N-acetyl-D-galactosamine dehydrogenase